MSFADDFITRNNGDIFKQQSITAPRKSVLKKNNVVYGEPKKIEPISERSACGESGNFSPVMEDDQIIGFVYECGCGEVAKILFEYQDDTSALAG